MRSIRQLFRQKIKTLAGILLVALAVAVLSVSFAQTLAAASTAVALEETFLTVALPAQLNPSANTSSIYADYLNSGGTAVLGDGNTYEAYKEQVLETYMERYESALAFPEEHPELFKGTYRHGLASAYIPALTLDNQDAHLPQAEYNTDNADYEPQVRSYAGAMLEVTLTQIGVPSNPGSQETLLYYENGTMQPLYCSVVSDPTQPVIVEFKATVDRIIALQEGYSDPTGFTLTFTATFSDLAAFEAEALALGDKCLVSAPVYQDRDLDLRISLVHSGRVRFWEGEFPSWHLPSMEVTYKTNSGSELDLDDPHFQAYFRQRIREEWPDLGTELLDLVRFLETSSQETRDDYAAFCWRVREDYQEGIQNGTFFQSSTLLPQIRVRIGDLWTKLTEEYQIAQFQNASLSDTASESVRLAKLSETAEEFLAENADWADNLEILQVNQHTFPILAVENLGYVADFSHGAAQICEGRDFTDEELANGAKVCVLSKSQAEASGLTVGDTLDLHYYDYALDDESIQYIHDGYGVVNPTAYRYRGEATPWHGEAETYTIVGLYDQDQPWCNTDYNLHSFTPNTVFVPKSAVTATLDYSEDGLFRTLVLHGDLMHTMQSLVAEAGLEGSFSYYDNGYTNLAKSLDGYRQIAEQFLPVGLLVYGVILALYLFLFPGSQGKELAQMESLGANMGQKLGHALASSLGILIPGTVLGTCLGLGLWDRVAQVLRQIMGTAVEVELEAIQLWAVSAGQVLVAGAMSLVLSWALIRSIDLMNRK